jgi:hypothetical protein
MPCFITIYFRIARKRTQTPPDLTAIANALVATVNRLGFTGRLYGAALQDVIGGFLSEGMSCGNIDLLGRIRAPDGTITYIRDLEMLVIPTLEGQMVSPQTTLFFVTAADIHIEVSTEIPVP